MTGTWRDRIEVHPVADMFPMMSDSEISELAADIRENGQRVGVILWTPERPEDVGPRKGPEKLFLLDGRNRLEAIERAFDDAEDRECAIYSALSYDWRDGGFAKLIYGDEDPYEVAVSANIRRRHLIGEQKREIVAELLRQHPERSDRATATIANVDHKTVAAVRSEAEGRGEISHVETRTDTAGRQQPAHKSLTLEVSRREIPLNVVPAPRAPTPEQISAVTKAKEQSARVMSGAATLERPQIQVVRETASDTMQQFLHLLRLDTAKTLDSVIRPLGTAKADIATVPKEKRIAAARGCLRALGLSDTDLQPIA